MKSISYVEQQRFYKPVQWCGHIRSVLFWQCSALLHTLSVLLFIPRWTWSQMAWILIDSGLYMHNDVTLLYGIKGLYWTCLVFLHLWYCVLKCSFCPVDPTGRISHCNSYFHCSLSYLLRELCHKATWQCQSLNNVWACLPASCFMPTWQVFIPIAHGFQVCKELVFLLNSPWPEQA